MFSNQEKEKKEQGPCGGTTAAEDSIMLQLGIYLIDDNESE